MMLDPHLLKIILVSDSELQNDSTNKIIERILHQQGYTNCDAACAEAHAHWKL